MASGSPTTSAMLCRGSSDEYGSWNTSCIVSRCRRSAGPRSEVMSLPSTTIVPLVGSMRRRISRARVDLPDPVSPTRPSVVPGRRSG